MTIIRRALTLELTAVALALAAGTAAAADVIATSDDLDRVRSDIAMNAQGRNVAAFALQINQRIASAALCRADALTARLDGGLSGGDIRLGAVRVDRIAATIAATRVSAAAPPAATRTVIAPAADKTGVVFTLSAGQLEINQRIGQAAIRRLNDVRSRLLEGISGDELRRATVTGANLTP